MVLVHIYGYFYHTSVSSKFGAAFDQLADLSCFGLSTAAYFVRHQAAKTDGSPVLIWFVGYVYAVCACARIARELVVHKIGKPEFFVGIQWELAYLY
eukprot:g1369.t1